MIELQVSTRGLKFEELTESISKDLRRELVERLAEVAYSEAFYGAPWKTGKLARSIVTEIEDGEATIKVLAPYAVHVIKGTKPHKIIPINARCLTFKATNGDLIFSKFVNHPGTKPNKFLEEAVEKARQKIDDLFVELFEELKA